MDRRIGAKPSAVGRGGIGGLILLACADRVGAASLGDLQVLSSLGQPLEARAPLSFAPGEDADRCTPRVGPVADAAELPGVRVAVVAEGAARFVRITSARPVREPLLEFELRMECAGQGTLARSYVALLDPPGYADFRGAVVTAPRPAPRPAAPRPPAPAAAAPAPRVAAALPALPEPTGYSAVTVRRGDTLFGLVARNYPRGSGDRRALVQAIMDANPSVFPDRNADRLPAGVTLRLPEFAAVAAAPTPAPAAAPEPAPAVPPAEPAAPEADDDFLLRILADVEEPVPAPADPDVGAIAPPAELPVAPAPGPAVPEAPPAADPEDSASALLQSELTAAQDRVEELNATILRLQERIAALEAAPPTPAAEPAPVAPPAASAPAWSSWLFAAAVGLVVALLAFFLGRSSRLRRAEADLAEDEGPRRFAAPASPRPEPADEDLAADSEPTLRMYRPQEPAKSTLTTQTSVLGAADAATPEVMRTLVLEPGAVPTLERPLNPSAGSRPPTPEPVPPRAIDVTKTQILQPGSIPPLELSPRAPADDLSELEVVVPGPAGGNEALDWDLELADSGTGDRKDSGESALDLELDLEPELDRTHVLPPDRTPPVQSEFLDLDLGDGLTPSASGSADDVLDLELDFGGTTETPSEEFIDLTVEDTEWSHKSVPALLLEAELHLLYDQRQEALAILGNLIDRDSGSRPDIRPWRVLFDHYRSWNDQEAFDRLAQRFRGRYNVVSPSWDTPPAPAGVGGLEAKFPRVLSRIEEIWGSSRGLEFLNGLLLDDRGGSRQGFELDVAEDIGFLRDVLYERMTG